jgi:hypothetical protein
MARPKQAESIDEGEQYYHVRYRDPDDFSSIRTPDWAESPAGSVVEDGEVRMGDEAGNDDWEVQSVLVPVDGRDEAEAERLADEIVEKIDA